MIKIKSVKFQNFMSYGGVPTEVRFDKPGTTLIVGKNGAGKTTIINALVYCLYDKPVSDGISKDSLVNIINKGKMHITVEFDVMKDSYRIVRARKMKPGPKGNYVQIFRNEKDITPDNIYAANDLIQKEILRINYELFVRIVTFAANHKPFLDLPAHHPQQANQRDIIEELFDLKSLSLKADLLSKKIKDNQRSIETAKKEIEFKKREKKKHQEQVKSAELRVSQWDEQQKEKIDASKKKLKGLWKIDTDKQSDLLSEVEEDESKIEDLESEKSSLELEIERKKEDLKFAKSQLEVSNRRVSKWNETTASEIELIERKLKTVAEVDVEQQKAIQEEITAIEDKIADLRKSDVDLSNQEKKARKLIDETSDEIEHLEKDECPYCRQSFKESKDRLAVAKKTFEEKTDEVRTAREERKRLETLISKETESLSAKRKLVVVEDVEELVKIQSEKDHLEERLQELNSAKNPHLDDNKERLKAVSDCDFNEEELIDRLTEIKKKIDKDRKSIEKKRKKLVVESIQELYDIKQSTISTEQKIKELTEEKNPHLEALEELKSTKPVRINMRRINTLTEEIEHQKFLYKILTRKDSFVRKQLIDKNIPYLNKQLKLYLTELELPYAVEFTEEMSTRITSFGNDLSFANMSAGQKSRINLALSFAFRDVLQNLNSRINVCMMDEVLDIGLDTEGIQIATKMLKNRSISDGLSMLIISHKSEEIDAFEKKMSVSMEGGFSSISYS